MKPVIALVGRPNVGKSTLFNQLTRSRAALVADHPGLTRDRIHGTGYIDDHRYMVVDTGGLDAAQRGLDRLKASQTRQAIAESDCILLLVDARVGCTPDDDALARRLRRYDKPLFLVINKTDGLDESLVSADFQALGIAPGYAIAASHGRGVRAMIRALCARYPADAEPPTPSEDAIRIAFVGKPNVGKSTLVNRLIGEERLLAYDTPGTTRDSIAVPFEYRGQPFVLVDTAGLRRRSRVREAIERFSAIKAQQAIEDAHVVILVLDGSDAITEQDAHLAGQVVEAGRAVVMAINKWDGLDEDRKADLRRESDRQLSFMDFAECHRISALHGSGVGLLMASAERAHRCASIRVATARLTQLLEQAVAQHAPPMVRGRRIKLRYAHQGGVTPPRFVIHGNLLDDLPASYRRYLTNYYRRSLDIQGTPIELTFRQGQNPYAGRVNRLTPRQARKRQRMIKHRAR